MKYVCNICGWTYDETADVLDASVLDIGIAPGTKWEDLPSDFTCPPCGAAKDNFSKEE